MKASACRFTHVKTIDNSIRTFPTQRQFEGFLLNSSENISTLHHTLWQYIHVFTSDTITHFFFFPCLFKPTKYPIESAAYNSVQVFESTNGLSLTLFVDKRHRNHLSITINKLKCHCFVPDICLARFKDRTYMYEWLKLKMLESVVSVLLSVIANSKFVSFSFV